jgi:uroporphyrin-III C-methyltransferase/precorrin-2 dehydrogenase/sirohydrochlorin ferrochelatase
MDQLPLFIDVRDRRIAVVGGGVQAARKAEMALRAGARVTAFAPEPSGELADLATNPRLTLLRTPATTEALAGHLLVYGVLDGEEESKRLVEMARAAGALVNVADTAELSDFIMPSIVDRSPLVVAISTAGTSPILGRIIKARIESWMPAAYGALARFVGAYREKVNARLSGATERRRFWERVLEGTPADLLLAGNEKAALAAIDDALEQAARGAEAGPPLGEVYLVGAGPGDPDLLTFRALHLMQRADVVVHDRLVGEEILRLVRREAERIYVGKLPQDHIVPQEEISRLLVRLAQAGKRVLRLKGGDPFIFGRGGEEIEMLAASGIPFQVVPGVTAAAGCAAYAGIPLTHRDHAQSCLFVTGHARADGKLDLDWRTLLQPHQTIAVYMGLQHLGALTAEFIGRGADPDLPAAVIDNGTRPNQRVVTGTLANLAERVAQAKLPGPAIIIVGTVVSLRDKLSWRSPVGADRAFKVDQPI